MKTVMVLVFTDRFRPFSSLMVSIEFLLDCHISFLMMWQEIYCEKRRNWFLS
jgi:hypothetical protein